MKDIFILISKIKKIGFESKFFGFPPWKYSNKENMRFHLFLEEFKLWLMSTYNVNINVSHRTHSQTYYFVISSSYHDENNGYIYEEKYSKYKTYNEALFFAMIALFEHCNGYLISKK